MKLTAVNEVDFNDVYDSDDSGSECLFHDIAVIPLYKKKYILSKCFCFPRCVLPSDFVVMKEERDSFVNAY